MEKANSPTYFQLSLGVTAGVASTLTAMKLYTLAPVIENVISSIYQEALNTKAIATNGFLSVASAMQETVTDHYVALAIGTVVSLAVTRAAKNSGIAPDNKPKRTFSTIINETAKLAMIGVGSAFVQTSLISAAPTVINATSHLFLPADEIAARAALLAFISLQLSIAVVLAKIGIELEAKSNAAHGQKAESFLNS